MFDIARDPKIWERVRNDEAFARHRKEIKEQYDKVFAVKPRCAGAWQVLDYPNVGGISDSFRQLQTSALMALIYPEMATAFSYIPTNATVILCDQIS